MSQERIAEAGGCGNGGSRFLGQETRHDPTKPDTFLIKTRHDPTKPDTFFIKTRHEATKGDTPDELSRSHLVLSARIDAERDVSIDQLSVPEVVQIDRTSRSLFAAAKDQIEA